MQQFAKIYLDEVKKRIDQTSPVIPAQRNAFKQGYTFSKRSWEDQLIIWDSIWKSSDSFRIRLHAFLFLDQHVKNKELHLKLWQTSALWQNDIDDWGLCNALAKINTKVLESYPAEVYAQLAKWNKNTDLWKRRQSVVSLLYFSRTKKAFLPFGKIAALVSPLLTDKEYYVQKGVGWTLREMHTVYPAETLPFLEQHIKSVSAIAFTIAIEKMDLPLKERFKSMRRK